MSTLGVAQNVAVEGPDARRVASEVHVVAFAGGDVERVAGVRLGQIPPVLMCCLSLRRKIGLNRLFGVRCVGIAGKQRFARLNQLMRIV